MNIWQKWVKPFSRADLYKQYRFSLIRNLHCLPFCFWLLTETPDYINGHVQGWKSRLQKFRAETTKCYYMYNCCYCRDIPPQKPGMPFWITVRITATWEIFWKVGSSCWVNTNRILADDILSRPRWRIWMRRPTGDQEVAGSTPAEVSTSFFRGAWSWNIFSGHSLSSADSIMACQFLAKECAQYWLTA